MTALPWGIDRPLSSGRSPLRRLIPAGACLALLLIAPPAAHAAEAPVRRVALRAARLIDGKGGPPLAGAVVLIEGERIHAVGANLPIPSGYEVIDLGGATLLPGLIDCHTRRNERCSSPLAGSSARTM